MQTACSRRITLCAEHKGVALASPPTLSYSAIENQRGYALVSLLVLMTLMALFAMAAVPNVKQQTQREREKEAIFRGEQVADAIRSYYTFKGKNGVNSLPTEMDQLLE